MVLFSALLLLHGSIGVFIDQTSTFQIARERNGVNLTRKDVNTFPVFHFTRTSNLTKLQSQENNEKLTPMSSRDGAFLSQAPPLASRQSVLKESSNVEESNEAFASYQQREKRQNPRKTYDVKNRCGFQFAYFTDLYGEASEFLFLDGTMRLPCGCPKTFCPHPDDILIGTNEPIKGQEAVRLFHSLPADMFDVTGSFSANEWMPLVLKAFRVPVTEKLFHFIAEKPERRYLHCKCGDDPEKMAKVEVPSYRICTDEECKEKCGTETETNALCTVDLRFKNMEATCSAPSYENRTCNETQRCCPDPDHFLYFKHHMGLCLEGERNYKTHGICRAQLLGQIKNTTWEVEFSVVLPNGTKEQAWNVLEQYGIYSFKNNSCDAEIGSEVMFGSDKVRALLTYQMTRSEVSMSLVNASACSKHKYPLHAFFCSNKDCSTKVPLAGSCESGWAVSWRNFSHFRHQVIITDEYYRKDEHGIPYDDRFLAPQHHIFKTLPKDRTFLRFFLIPNTILAVVEMVGNKTTKKTCLLPAGNKVINASDDCLNEELEWRTCFPIIQQFTFGEGLGATHASPPTPTGPDDKESMPWWQYVLIGTGVVLVIALIVVALCVFIRKRKPKMLQVAGFWIGAKGQSATRSKDTTQKTWHPIEDSSSLSPGKKPQRALKKKGKKISEDKTQESRDTTLERGTRKKSRARARSNEYAKRFEGRAPSTQRRPSKEGLPPTHHTAPTQQLTRTPDLSLDTVSGTEDTGFTPEAHSFTPPTGTEFSPDEKPASLDPTKKPTVKTQTEKKPPVFTPWRPT